MGDRGGGVPLQRRLETRVDGAQASAPDPRSARGDAGGPAPHHGYCLAEARRRHPEGVAAGHGSALSPSGVADKRRSASPDFFLPLVPSGSLIQFGFIVCRSKGEEKREDLEEQEKTRDQRRFGWPTGLPEWKGARTGMSSGLIRCVSAFSSDEIQKLLRQSMNEPDPFV